MTLNETATEPLLLRREGPVATITINRPDRLNSLTYAMFTRLPQVLAEAAALDGVRVLVLRGAGRRSFSAGADISEFETMRTTAEQAAAYDDAVLAAVASLAATLAARSGVTQRAVKQTVARILDGVSADDATHAALREAALAAPDYAEGVRAFLERRPPRF